MKRQCFNDHWVFYKRDSDSKLKVTLPHDAQIIEERDASAPGGSAHAFFPGGYYIYEKSFDVPADWQDKCISFQFEGVYKDAKVFINGKEAGGRPNGYMPFFVNGDGLLDYGAVNMIRVEVDNVDLPNSRWYTGAGIYRSVWLWVGEKSHIEIEGVQISTLSISPARIEVKTAHVGGDVSVEIRQNDLPIAKGSGDQIELDIPNAKLWSAEKPNLYTCHVTLRENGAIVDEVSETFGIREIRWSNKGLFINGQETLLRGGCVHHDNGILGARSFAKSEERRVRIMKEAGFNAIRSSHNLASKGMIEACDKYGMYMIDETWDMWYSHKSKYDYATDFMDNWQEDIRAMVSRDFNHPSVIMYSIGNEVAEPATTKGVDLAKEMVTLLHSLDSTRPVTAGMNLMILSRSAKGNAIYKEDGGRDESSEKKAQGMNSTMFNIVASMVGTSMNMGANSKKADAVASPVLDALDIAGYNYASGRYPLEGKAHPNRLIYGSETFPQDIYKNWEMVKKYPYLVGDFMWTAWDYIGETGIGAWSYASDGAGFAKPYPWLLGDVGVFDLLGNPNGELYLAQAAWGLLHAPAIAVQPVNHPTEKPAKAAWRGTNAIPSWSWKGCEGNRAVVEVYSNGDLIELQLNGRTIGKKKVKAGKATFKTKYAPGNLTAIAYNKAGTKLSESQLLSAKEKLSIAVLPEEKTIATGDIAYVAIQIVDSHGIVESNGDAKLTVQVEGGELLAFGSANPRTTQRYDSGSFTPYYGQAQAVVKATKGATVSVTVSSETLNPVTATIQVTNQ